MQTLQDVVKPYSHIRLATKEDNDKIIEFYKDIHMQTGDEALSFDRGDDFFKFYERKGNHFWSFVFLNDDGSFCGVGTIIRHLRYVGGSLRPVAYFCDLRVSPVGGRRAKVQWRKLFAEIIEALPNLVEGENCDMAYTAILSDNEKAINSLTKSGRGFNYRHIDNYHVYSVVCPPLFNPTRARIKEITFERFYSFYMQEAYGQDLVEEVEKDSSSTYYGVFDGGDLSAVFMVSNEEIGRTYKVYNLKMLKRILTRIVELMGRPKVDNGLLKSLEVRYLCFAHGHDNDSKKEIVNGIIKYFQETNELSKYHICNLYTGQDKIDFSLLIDGIVVESKGHMFEIHGDSNQGLWPMKPFRFEGSVL